MPLAQSKPSDTPNVMSKSPVIALDSLTKNSPPRKLHFVLQGKGGVGKTTISLFLSQFLHDQGRPLVLFDTDPVNATFANLSPIPAEPIRVLDGEKIDSRSLDALVERLATEDADFVVDNGAASFLPLSRYLIENDIATLLADAGRQVVVHTVLTGGPMMLDTFKGFESIVEDYPESVQIVVWTNNFLGPVMTAEGKTFQELSIYAKYKHRIFALIDLPALSPAADADFKEMTSRKLLLSEAIHPQPGAVQMHTVPRSRLFRMRAKIWPQIERALA